LRRRLAGADLCITGEGRLDSQSLAGKAPIAVARLCKELGVPCFAIVGCAGEGADAARTEGLVDWIAIGGPSSIEDSIRRAAELLEMKAVELLRRVRNDPGVVTTLSP
jgi:glycerate kinase